MKQGARANASGRLAEDMIAAVLEQVGLRVERQVDVGPGIYEKVIRADFLVHGVPGFDGGVFIESKYQDSSGSVDEKLPYLVENIRERYPLPAIVILLGDGFSDGAVAWMRAQEGGNLARVLVGNEWMRWAFRLRGS